MSQLVRLSTKPQPPSFLSRAKWALRAARSVWSGPYSSKDPALSKLFGSGYEAYAGVTVTDENAMTFSAVFSAVLQISSDVAKLPLNLHKRRQGGGSDHYIDSRLYHLLKHEPNPEMSSMTFRQTLTAHALTCHGGYAEIERDMHGRPKAIWILTPDRVEPFRRDQYDRATGRKMLGPLEYRIDGDDNQILPMRDVIHVSGLGYDGITGYSVINKARQAIGLALAMEKFGGQYFGKGTVFGGHLSSDTDLEEDQKKDIRENIEAFRKAQDSAWRILVTGAGTKFTQFAAKPSDSQMDESRTAQVLEVARFFRMPPVKLGVNSPGAVSYASSEQADLDYYKGAMLDWITREEQEFNRKLIPASERRQQFIKHNATAFLRADTAARTAFYEKMLVNGVFNADMVLDLEDMNPQADGQGQHYFIQGAMVAKEQLVEMTDAKIALVKKKTTEPAAAPAAGGTTDPAADPDPNDDQARAIAALGEQLAAMTAAVSTMGGERQARFDQMRDDLEATRLDKAAGDAAVAQARHAVETLTAERDAAAARATEMDAAAQAATTEREAAEAAAAQARTEATAAALAVIEAESARQAALADQQAAGERLAELQARVDTMAGELAGVRADLETTRAAREAAALALTAAETGRAADVFSLSAARDEAAAVAEALRAEMAAHAEAQTSILTEREQALAEARAQLAEAQALLGQTDGERTARIAELSAEVERLSDDITARTAAAEADQARQATERAALAASLATTEQAQAALEARIADLATATAAAEAEAVRLAQALSEAEVRAQAERERLTSEAAPIRAALAEAEESQAALHARIADSEAARSAAEAAAAQAQQHLAGERAARIERMTATIAAHRGLVSDAVGRLARRAAQQARAKQATPEKLRRWLDSYLSAEAPICVEALLPVMRVRLAAQGSTEDPVAVTVALVTEHMAAFEALIRGALDVPAEDFHAELERVLTRWETDRGDEVADKMLRVEVNHVLQLKNTNTQHLVRSADPSKATAPKYVVGDRVVSLVGHMKGMKGMAGAVNEANAGSPPYYAIDFDEPMGEGNPHKWLNEDEIESEDDMDEM